MPHHDPRPAFAGGSPVRKAYLPLCKPFIGNEEKQEVLAALDSGWLSAGPRTKKFEQAAADYIGVGHAVAVNSCTAGLHLALVAAGIGPGDEVITSPFTFSATANVILHVGATPVFADIDPLTYNIDPMELAAKITARTKAIMPVHYGGQSCDLGAISALARQYNLLVIEDAATAIGTEYHGRKIGSYPEHVAVFSFYATKTMTTGDGGLITTHDEALAQKIRMLSMHGMSRDAWKRYSSAGSWYFEVTQPGFKYNMTDIQAALGLHQLRRLDGFIERRQAICARYDDAFAHVAEITRPHVATYGKHGRYIYPILLDQNALQIDRAEFIEALKAENIGSSVHYIPVHLHQYYQEEHGFKRGDFPVTENIYDRLVSLPLFPHMSDRDVNDVITAVRRLVAFYGSGHARQAA